MNNTKLTKYLFGLGSFIIVFYLAINTNEVNTQAVIQKENIITEKQKLNQIDEGDFSVTKEKLKDLTDLPSVEDESFETIDNNTDYIDLAEDQKSIFVNNIKIAKQIDSDESSDTYREPISSYKTITTLDKNVTKTINYYPEFYIWTSINTEFMDLNQKNQVAANESESINILQPAKLLMIVTCNENVISEFDYQINAKTPRWREWVKIDLTQFENKPYDGSNQTEPNKNEFEFTLPQSKRKITFMAMNESKERKVKHQVESLKKANRKIKDMTSRQLTTRLKNTILSIDGSEEQKDINHFVDNELFAVDSRALRAYITKVTPDIDLTFEFISEESGEGREMTLPMDIGFFWPNN